MTTEAWVIAVGLFMLAALGGPAYVQYAADRYRRALQTFAQHGAVLRKAGGGVCPCSTCSVFRRRALAGVPRSKRPSLTKAARPQ